MIYRNADFIYDGDTGELRHASNKGRAIKECGLCGQKTGCGGYLQVRLNGKKLLQHRVAWFIVHGYWPKEIDHVNGIKHDNRLVNLREVNHRENNMNRGIRSDNTSGFTGVWYRIASGKWQSQICFMGKLIYLGVFKEKRDAIRARQYANLKYGFHRNHGNKIKEVLQ